LFSEDGKSIDWKFEPYDLKSRIVSPLSFKFQITEDGTPPIRSTAGDGFPISSPWAARKILGISKERVSDTLLGQPSRTQRETLMVGVRPIGNREVGCRIQSPWLTLERSIEMTPEGTLIREDFATLKSRLTFEEAQSPEFPDFQMRLRNCADGAVLIYAPMN
jgi:hypothetical protein